MTRNIGNEIDLMFAGYRAMSAIPPVGRPAAMEYLRDRLDAETVNGKVAAMAVARFARRLSKVLASVDTHAKRGDVEQAPSPMGSAVPPQAGDAQPSQDSHP